MKRVAVLCQFGSPIAEHYNNPDAIDDFMFAYVSQNITGSILIDIQVYDAANKTVQYTQPVPSKRSRVFVFILTDLTDDEISGHKENKFKIIQHIVNSLNHSTFVVVKKWRELQDHYFIVST